MRILLAFLLISPIFLQAQSQKALDLYGEGVKNFYSEDYEQAIKFFSESIQLEEDFQIALFNRGQALMQLKSYSKAIEDFNHVIGLDSNYVDAYKELSTCLIKTNKFKEAISQLHKMIAFNPNVVSPYKQLGLCYYYTRKYQLAEDANTVYLNGNGNENDLKAWFQKGLSNFYYADYQTAIKDFTAVYELNNQYTTALEWRGRCYQKANYINKACADWELAIEKGLKSSEDYLQKYCGPTR